jgi:protein O-GlcNAc transferase
MKGNVALSSGRVREAIAFYDRAAEVQADYAVWGQNALFVRNYSDEVDANELFAAHREWGLKQPRVEHVTKARPVLHRRHRLKIGFVSPDLRRHSVAHFVTPILGYIDSAAFEVICYYNHRSSDVVTSALRRFADTWRSVTGKSARMVAEMIARDEVDVLVDLAGHSAANRLDVFAYAPARMQVTYLGYPTTTGVRAMHYRLTDWVVDPEGAEALSTERLLRLPDSYFCYMAPEEAPAVSNLPALSRSGITFGSFNNMAKLTPTTLRIWGRLLKALPQSRLRLKNKSLENAMVRNDLLQRIRQYGVEEDRVQLMGWESARTSHFALYNDIDIALDTLPYNGATTTCEALWMGVPVVTLSGSTHASRMGASILSAAKVGEQIAEDEDAYVNICRALAADVAKLAGLRARLRSRIASSPLMNYIQFARNFERTLLTAWERNQRG